MNDASAPAVPAGPAELVCSRYGNLDVSSGPELDDLAQLAAHTCGTPIAMVTVVDQQRQFFKARIGTQADESSLEVGFCPEVVSTGKLLTIADTAADPVHAANPATLAGTRFYAGVPLISPSGNAFGTLCVLDHVPRVLTSDQRSALGTLARQVMTHIELRLVLRRERESEMRHNLIVDSAIDHAIIGLDCDGRVTDWNAGAERILGWSATEMRGQTIERLFTPEDRKDGRLLLKMRQALDAERAMNEHWHVKQDGSQFWASGDLTLIRDGCGKHAGFLAVLRDWTGKRRREQRFALLAEAAAGLLKATDPDQVLGPILEQSRELLGFDASYSYMLSPDCEHLHLIHSLGVGEEFRATLANASFDLPLCGLVAQTRRPVVINNLQATTEARYELGRQAGYDAFAGFPMIAGGKLYGVLSFGSCSQSYFDDEALIFFETLARYVAVVRERLDAEARLRQWAETLEKRVQERTAELQSAEEALRQSQKMEAVGQLTGGLAHDFNNLLAGISGSLELLQTRVSQGRLNDLDRYLVAAQGAAKRAAALTHRLLAFTRRQTLDPKSTDVNRLVAGMDELVRRTVGPAVTVEVVDAARLWTVLADQNQLENALLNLCINARDAMPDGGRLTIESSNLELDERSARMRDLLPGQYVSLCVSDTGTGMTPEIVRRAFDPFFTTKPIGMGTGLGLSMVYGFMQQSGGQARIHSEPGRGASVCLYLPQHHGKAGNTELPAELADAPRAVQGETVLVVDDEPTVRMLVAEVLKELGYTVIEAADGPAGLQVLRSDVRIDLLVTDVGLPGGMNGRQVADAARVVRPGLKVLFITGYAENAVLSHGHLEPGMHVLTKPFAMEALAGRIKELIARP